MNKLLVDYSEDVTPEQVRQLDDLVRKEFETGNWVTVEKKQDLWPIPHRQSSE